MNKQHFGKEYSTDASENYERFFVPSIGAPAAEELIKHTGLQPGERVLDVACGTGIVTRKASEIVGDSGYTAGLDINPGMLSVARKVSPDVNEWIESSAEEIPVTNNSYDVVLCQISLQFVPDKLKALKEMYRVLVPGGRLIFNTPGPISPLYKAFAETLKEHIGPEAAGFVERVFSFNDPDEMKRLLTEAEFKDVSIEQSEMKFKYPASRDFLWQYISSTPLFAMISNADEDTISEFEKKIISRWSEFNEDGKLNDRLNVIFAKAKK